MPSIRYSFLVGEISIWVGSRGAFGRWDGAVVAAEGIGDYPLELAVERAKFLRGPRLDPFHGCGIEAQKEALYRFFLCHVPGLVV